MGGQVMVHPTEKRPSETGLAAIFRYSFNKKKCKVRFNTDNNVTGSEELIAS